MTHEFFLMLSKSWGLFYLIFLFGIAVVYALWPANKEKFDRAAKSIFHDQDEE